MTFRSVGTGVAGTGTAAAPGKPANLKVGDIVVLSLYVQSGDATITWPTGFTQKIDTGTSNATTRGRELMAVKRITVDDDATDEPDNDYDISWTTSALYNAVATAFSDIVRVGAVPNSTDPTHTTKTFVSTNTSAVTGIGPGAFSTSDRLVDIVGSVSNHATNAGAWSAETGYSKAWDNSASGVANMGVFYSEGVAPGTQNPTFATSGTTGSTFPRSAFLALVRDRAACRSIGDGPVDLAVSAQTATLLTHKTGDRMRIAVGVKPDTASDPTMDNGWTKIKSLTGGTGAVGADTGPMKLCIFEKVATSDSETNPTITPGAGTSSWGWSQQIWKPQEGYTWADSVAANADYVVSATDTTVGSSTFTGTTGALTNQPTDKDGLSYYVTGPSDAGTAMASISPTATGLANGQRTLGYTDSQTGDDMMLGQAVQEGFTGPVSSGFTFGADVTGWTGENGIMAVVSLRQTLIQAQKSYWGLHAA